MRPQVLFPLFAANTSLSGVGPKLAQLIEKIAGPRLVDLLYHIPNRVIHRRQIEHTSPELVNQDVVIELEVISHAPPPRHRRRLPYKVHCLDSNGNKVDLVFFNAQPKYLHEQLPEHTKRFVAGKLEYYRKVYQITHPDHTKLKFEDMLIHESVYPVTAGLSAKSLTKIIGVALTKLVPLPEWQDKALLRRRGWTDWQQAVETIHKSPGDIPATERLAYDELLSNQLALALIRQHAVQMKGHKIKGNGKIRQKILKGLPFQLTASQESALHEIYQDMEKPHRMMRLLQGDVGSGKTVIALMAMLNAVECGFQAAIMAPTEILARQHFETLTNMCKGSGVRVACLTGRDKGETRKKITKYLADGTAQIIVGTHALFQEKVTFKNLGFAVIDEQHRFGVHQRLNLSAKGQAPDVLVMTATPIPRTLLLTAYGDMDSSQLTDKPPGRKPIDTRLISLDRLDAITKSLEKPLKEGKKIYWVCPLVEESDVLDVSAAEERFEYLKRMLGQQIGLIHGRMKETEKDAAMQDFINGPTNILVATTVIEVGVDVPAASIMIIEHAERFGLSQLHQLRGRVGRGSEQSNCLLLYKSPPGDIARRRLETMRATEDGFKIAEEDFKLRGGGEILGTRQSGDPEFKVANLSLHSELLQIARDDVELILNKDPQLINERGKALRVLLYLFERDQAVKYLKSG